MRYSAILLLMFFVAGLQAQNKKAPAKTPPVKKEPEATAAPVDTVDKNELAIQESMRFAVYSKKIVNKDERRTKFCIQLAHHDDGPNPAHRDTILRYCINDSIIHDPEVKEELFKREDGDTCYVLVFVDSFTKNPDKPSCDAGKETKLFFFKWNLKTNRAVMKQKSINSCMRAITNMTKEPIEKWDRQSPLLVQYHRGGTRFEEFTFDPANYKLGFQSNSSDK